MAAKFYVLGPIEAVIDGRTLDLGHVTQRSVLGVLLVEANRVVAADALVERIWGAGVAPKDPRGALHTSLWRLRRVLAAVGDVALVRQGAGYRLAVDEGQVDLHRFRGLLAQNESTGDDERAAKLIEQALGLWRGDAFGALDTPWLAGVRAVLEQERRAAEWQLTDRQLRLGRHGTLLARLSSQVGLNPLDERLSGQLMLALYRSGRGADALLEYRRLRSCLADELGADPGSALQLLHERILKGDSALSLTAVPSDVPAPAGELAQSATSAPVAATVPRQLPAASRWFTGRRAELDALHGPLASRREKKGVAVPVVAIDGMAGVGKTALAVLAAHELAGQFPDGQLFVDLYGHTQGFAPRAPGEVLECFLRALGVPTGQIPRDAQERAALYRQRLSATRTLILLDNAATEAQIRPLLPGDTGCLVLITSRRRLKGLDEALPISLGALSPHDALALLRAMTGETDAFLQDAVLTEIADLCGRLPLALRIAAALVRHRPGWGLEHLAGLLRDQHRRMGALVDGDRDLGAAFDLSYSNLPDAHRRLFRLLGLVPGPEVNAYAAAALADTGPTVMAGLLEDLVDHNLLIPYAAGRYRMHDLLRLHARELAVRDPADERDAAVARLLDYYQHTAAAEDLVGRAAETRARRSHARTHRRVARCGLLRSDIERSESA